MLRKPLTRNECWNCNVGVLIALKFNKSFLLFKVVAIDTWENPTRKNVFRLTFWSLRWIIPEKNRIKIKEKHPASFNTNFYRIRWNKGDNEQQLDIFSFIGTSFLWNDLTTPISFLINYSLIPWRIERNWTSRILSKDYCYLIWRWGEYLRDRLVNHRGWYFVKWPVSLQFFYGCAKGVITH